MIIPLSPWNHHNPIPHPPRHLRGHRQHGVFLHVDVHVHFVAPQEAATEAAQGAPGGTTAPYGKHPIEVLVKTVVGKNTISSGYYH